MIGRFRPHDFFDRRALEHYIRWGYGVYKSKYLHREDIQKDFRSKNFLWPVSEAVKVEKAKNSVLLKSAFRPDWPTGENFKLAHIFLGRLTL